MSFIIPFNHNPVSTSEGNIASATYTVASGKYVRVVATMQAVAEVGVGGGGSMSSATSLTTLGGVETKVVEFWLDDGDTFNMTSTNASDTDYGSTPSNVWLEAKDTASVECVVNGTTVSQVSCYGYYAGSFSGTGTIGPEIGGISIGTYIIEEYNKVS